MSLLLLYVGKNRYAIDNRHILRIIPLVGLKEMPSAPHYMAGVWNLWGAPVPVVDFCQLVEERPAHSILSTRIVFVKDPHEHSDKIVGIIGEHVKDFLYIDIEEFKAVNFNMTPFPFLNRVYTKNSEMIHYIDILELFSFLSHDLFQPKERHGD